ncbi:hypothetical protein BH11ACT1_BH11ACT1_13710 [soil metagenome]
MNRISLSLALRRRAQDDRGIALVVVVALMALIGVMIVTLVSLAIYESRASGRDRQRSSAVMTAEGQVDSLVSQIQTAPIATLPCGTITPADVAVRSDVMSLTNTVKYFTAAGVEVACPVPTTTVLASATIKSTSTSKPLAGQAPAVRTVETLLKLTPSYDNDLTKAIFGDAGITLANQANIYGENGQPNADVYTNGNVTCNNNQHYFGSIYAQGSVSMSNTCVVEVDVWSKLGYSATNPGVSVNGKVLVSNGNITLNSSSVGQQARASGTVTGNVCSTAGKCFGGQTVDAPPAQAFPQYIWDSTVKAAWIAEGYTVKEFPDAANGYPCGMYSGTNQDYNGSVDNVARWVYENMATMPKTVIYANCPGNPFKVQRNHSTIALNSDLAIFDTGGFNISNNTTIKSSTSTHHLLYLIQPYDSVSVHPCTADGISLDNQVTIEDTIDELLYSPCSIRKANNSTHYGQIYGGGNVTIDNRLTMYYRPLPVFGLVVTGQPIKYYSADILYKRENNP